MPKIAARNLRAAVSEVRRHDRSTDEEFEVEEGSGNVFADLGFPNPEDHLAKAKLASAILKLIESRGWTQSEAAAHLQTVQPTISDLRRGRFRGLSVERLLGWLVALDQDVQITVRPAKNITPV